VLGLAGLIAGCDAPRRPHVVAIVVDTLRADHLGFYGYTARPTTPLLDRRVASAAVFERFYSTSSWTLPAFGTLFTGRLPTRHGAGRLPATQESAAVSVPMVEHHDLKFGALDDDLPTLAEELRSAGYRTGAVLNNEFLKPSFGVARGYESYDLPEHPRLANVTVDDALAWVDSGDERPFFLTLHFLDPHVSYARPAPFRRRFAQQYLDQLPPGIDLARTADVERLQVQVRKREPGWQAALQALEAAYDEEIAFLDAEIDRFLRGLEERGLAADTVVILTADHGEGFGDHAWFGHGNTMFDELLRVPFVVWGPGVRPGRRTTPASARDVMPTVLAAAGLSADLPGWSLWPNLIHEEPLPERPLFAEHTFSQGEKKAVIRWPYKAIDDVVTGKRWLFDLALDPEETIDLSSVYCNRLEGLLADLEEALPVAPAPREAELSADSIEQLQSLGYIRK
jgi:arylsulfatase A-like enzyme